MTGLTDAIIIGLALGFMVSALYIMHVRGQNKVKKVIVITYQRYKYGNMTPINVGWTSTNVYNDFTTNKLQEIMDDLTMELNKMDEKKLHTQITSVTVINNE